MNEKFASKVLEYIKRSQDITESDERICRYTLEGLFSFFTKVIVIIIISNILGTATETLLLFLLYGLLRTFAFGIHATKDVYCWISSIIIYIISPFIVKYLDLTINLYYIFFIIFTILLVIYSPADTPKRPLIRENKRIRNKFIVSIILLIYSIITIIFFNSLLSNAILIGMLLQTISVIPITYNIFGIKYNNYLYYKSNKV